MKHTKKKKLLAFVLCMVLVLSTASSTVDSDVSSCISICSSALSVLDLNVPPGTVAYKVPCDAPSFIISWDNSTVSFGT